MYLTVCLYSHLQLAFSELCLLAIIAKISYQISWPMSSSHTVDTSPWHGPCSTLHEDIWTPLAERPLCQHRHGCLHLSWPSEIPNLQERCPMQKTQPDTFQQSDADKTWIACTRTDQGKGGLCYNQKQGGLVHPPCAPPPPHHPPRAHLLSHSRWQKMHLDLTIYNTQEHELGKFQGYGGWHKHATLDHGLGLSGRLCFWQSKTQGNHPPSECAKYALVQHFWISPWDSTWEIERHAQK